MVKVNISDNIFNEIEFNEFCKKYGFVFPKSFLDYLHQYNTAVLEPNIIHMLDNDCYVRYFYGTGNEDYSNIDSVYQWYIDRLPQKCVPIADPDFGNQICMCLNDNEYGKIYFWDHETMDTDENEKCFLRVKDMILLADSFDELLNKITEPKDAIETSSATSPFKKIFFKIFK